MTSIESLAAFGEVLPVVRRKRKTTLQGKRKIPGPGRDLKRQMAESREQKEPVMGPTPENMFWASGQFIPSVESRRGILSILAPRCT